MIEKMLPTNSVNVAIDTRNFRRPQTNEKEDFVGFWQFTGYEP